MKRAIALSVLFVSLLLGLTAATAQNRTHVSFDGFVLGAERLGGR